MVGEYIDTVLTQLLQCRLKPTQLNLWPSGFASQCAVCHSWPSRQVCQACVSRFSAAPRRCQACALPLPADLSMGLRSGPAVCADCARQRPPLDETLAAVAYAYPWSTLIAQYKFGEQPAWAGFFAELLLQAPGVQPAFASMNGHDWVIPMPLSATRLQTRGFNQAWELACALSRQSHTRAQADAGLLLRVKDTRPQSQLKREARLANVKGAFQVDPLRAAALAGRSVLLVDDVMTSGASMFAAAQALRDGGAAHVTAVVLARTQ